MRYIDLRRQEQLLVNWSRWDWRQLLNDGQPAESPQSEIRRAMAVATIILQDDRLKLAGLALSKIRTIVTDLSLIVLLQDSALPLAGKKIARMIELYGESRYRYWQAQTLQLAAVPDVNLSFLSATNFIADCQQALLYRLYASDYLWLAEHICTSLQLVKAESEIAKYWQKIDDTQLISALRIAFLHNCRPTYRLSSLGA